MHLFNVQTNGNKHFTESFAFVDVSIKKHFPNSTIFHISFDFC